MEKFTKSGLPKISKQSINALLAILQKDKKEPSKFETNNQYKISQIFIPQNKKID